MFIHSDPELGAVPVLLERSEEYLLYLHSRSSFVPFSYKKASVVSRIQRAISVCSSYSLLAVELDEIRRICQLNGYPRGFVDTRIGIGLTKYLNKTNNNNSNSEESNLPVAGCDKDRMYVEVPFIGDQTDQMEKKLQHLSATIRPDLDVRFYAKPPRSVRTFFPNKVPVPKHLQSNTVYTVKCEDCGDTYVGMTKRQTITRQNEHGAPRDLFERAKKRKKNNNEDTDKPIDSQQQAPASTNTTTEVKTQQQQQQQKVPPRRSSSRVRERIAALATQVTNKNVDPASAHADVKKKKKKKKKETKKDDTKKKEAKKEGQQQKEEDNPSSIAEHVQSTGHKMDWKNFRILWRDSTQVKRKSSNRRW